MEVQGSAAPAPAPAPTASPQPAPAVAAPGEARAADFSPVATAAGAGAAAAGVGGEKSSPSPAPVMSSGGGVGGPYGAGMMSLGSSVSMMAGSGGGDDLTPKKRGRPRKYSPDGSGMALALCPTPSEFSSGGAKRGRGRPPGSGRRQLLSALGGWFAYSAGGSFTPHVVAISTGEDVAARILSFSQKGPRSICVLSANGAISNVTLRQPGSSGGTLTYEGRFEILSLSGSYTMIDNGGVRSRTGGISVSLAGPDGRVVGGGVAGSLIAASPIQVVVGSFVPNALKEQKKKPNPESLTYPITPTSTGSFTAGRPTSQAAPGNECVTPTVAALPWKNHDLVGNSVNSTPDLNCTSFKPSAWQGLEASSEHKASPDINICLHGD